METNYEQQAKIGTNNPMYNHYITLKNYVFAKKYISRNGGFFYQLFRISGKACKIGGMYENGFILQFLDGSSSDEVATVELLYKCIRYQKDEFLAFR